MANENQMALAKSVYGTLCAAIDRREWKYEKDEENLIVHFAVSGDDIPMQFNMVVDAERQIVRVASPLPFKMAEDKRMEGAIATCVASFGLAHGNFDYDLSDGTISFRLTSSFRGSLIGEDLFQYMISCSCTVVDEYNDKFLAINKGMLSINDFITSVK